MKNDRHDAEAGQVGQLLLDIARVHHWTGLYAPGHPILSGRIDALRASLSGEARRDPSGMLVLGIARDRVLFRERFFGGDHPLVSNFTEVLYRRHVATLGIAEDVTSGELAVFFRCLHDLRSGKIDDPPEEYLLREGIRGIRLSPVNYKEVLSRGMFATEASPRSEPRQEALWRALLSTHLPTEDDERKILQELAEFPELLPLIMKRAVAAVAGESAPPSAAGTAPGFIAPDVLRSMFRRLGLALKALPENRRKELLGLLVEGIAPPAGESESPVPEAALAVAHSLNVCGMVVAQAARLDLSEAALRDIGLAALLHDIGKELVPAEILNKPGKLDTGEFAKISLPPVLGASHLRKMSLGSDLPVIVCYEHHIRHDRSGYPTSRFPDAPHPASLMTQIAGVYDALRTHRPYRASLDRETALGILREGRGTEFEPVLLDRFLRMVS